MQGHSAFIIRFTIFAACHSLFATNRVKRLVALAAGREVRSYRLLYNITSFIMFGWVLAAGRSSEVLYFVPGIWSLIMYLLQVAVAVALFRCIRRTGLGDFLGISQLEKHLTPERKLVTDGFYSAVRHPLYLLSMIFLLLNPVMTIEWMLLTVMTLAYFICGGLIEEQRLVEEFGDQYRRYRCQVPFMIPSLRRFRHPDD